MLTLASPLLYRSDLPSLAKGTEKYFTRFCKLPGHPVVLWSMVLIKYFQLFRGSPTPSDTDTALHCG